MQAIFSNNNKQRRSGSLSIPFLRTQLPPNTKIFPLQLAFQVKITDIDNYYKLKSRLCLNGSSMIEGIDFDISFAPVADSSSIRILCSLATLEQMYLIVLDISNAFQSTHITDPSQRHHMSLPAFYLEWFRLRWPNHPILQYSPRELVIQCLNQIQGARDAGNSFFTYLSSVFKAIDTCPLPSNKGILVWYHQSYKSYFAISTDDILMVTQHESCVNILEQHISQFFEYQIQRGAI